MDTVEQRMASVDQQNRNLNELCMKLQKDLRVRDATRRHKPQSLHKQECSVHGRIVTAFMLIIGSAPVKHYPCR